MRNVPPPFRHAMTSARKIRQHDKLHKPRNPLVVPLMQRQAGAHRKSHKHRRQREERDLRATLAADG